MSSFGSPPANKTSAFGGLDSVVTSTPASIFGGSANATSNAPTNAFGGFGISSSASPAAPTNTSSASVFGSIPKPDQSVFGAPPANASPFGQPPAVDSTASAFGNAAVVTSPTSPFGAAQPTNGGSIFGAAATANSPPTSSSVFGSGGGLQQQQSQSGGVFGGGGGSIFSSPKPEPAFGSTPFGSSSQPNPASGGSMFGGSPFAAANNTNTQQSSGGSMFGGGFGGSFSQNSNGNAASVFGSPSAFGQQQPQQQNNSSFGNSGFAQGGPSIAQTGFGSPVQQNTGFATTAPAFGSSPAFGGAATFGSPKAGFGTFANMNTASFPAAPQQGNSLFESLGSAQTGMTFGNLAQGANVQASPPAPKSAFGGGGGSFSSWR